MWTSMLRKSLLVALILLQHPAHIYGDGGDPTCDAASVWDVKTLDLRSQDFWRSVATAAGVNVHIAKEKPDALKLNTADKNVTLMREKMKRDGYFHLNDWGEKEKVKPLMKELVRVIEEINNVRQLPATFVMVYDEPWEVAQALSSYLEPVYGLKLSHDFYVFNVKPGAEGWDIHRDGEGYDNILSFQKEDPLRDLPTYTTTWVAVSDASEETSCMFFIPAHADKNYAILDHATGVDDDFNFNDGFDRDILKDQHRYIHSAPVESGNSIVWSHRTLHWSSMSPPDAPHARFSMAFSMSLDELDPPLLKHTDHSVPPPFEARLALICYTGVAYHYNFHSPLKNEILHLLLDVLADDEYASHLTDEALSPAHDRQVAGQFSKYLERMYDDEDLEDVEEAVEELAYYIVKVRGLESTSFLRELADDLEAELQDEEVE